MPGIVKLFHFGMTIQPVRNDPGIVLMQRQAGGQRSQAADAEPGFERPENSSEQFAFNSSGVLLCRRIGKYCRSADYIAVTADVFGHRMHHDIDPHRDRLLEQRRCPGIVDHGFDPVRFRNLSDRRNILQGKHNGRRALQIEEICILSDCLLKLLRIVSPDIRRFHVHLFFQISGHKGMRRAVNILYCDDMPVLFDA